MSLNAALPRYSERASWRVTAVWLPNSRLRHAAAVSAPRAAARSAARTVARCRHRLRAACCSARAVTSSITCACPSTLAVASTVEGGAPQTPALGGRPRQRRARNCQRRRGTRCRAGRRAGGRCTHPAWLLERLQRLARRLAGDRRGQQPAGPDDAARELGARKPRRGALARLAAAGIAAAAHAQGRVPSSGAPAEGQRPARLRRWPAVGAGRRRPARRAAARP